MASADELWVAGVRREQLIELFEGRFQGTSPVPLRELGGLRQRAGEFTAVWRSEPVAGRWPVPHALIVEEENTDDLLAWAVTYLRDLGPLTAQVRILSPSRLVALFKLKPFDLRGFVGGAIGLVFCEAIMHSRHGPPLAMFGASASRSTLSYALLRARHLGFDWESLAEISERFGRLRRDAKQSIPMQSIDAVLSVTRTFLEAIAGASVTTVAASDGWLTRLLSGGDAYELAEEILSRPVDLLGRRSVSGLAAMTAEERVQLLDEVAPTLLDGSLPRLDRAFALALAAFVCRPGLEQQAGLLAEYARRLPEAWLWLGVMQCRSSLSEVLSSGDAAGWWIARELLRTDDPFEPPRADVSGSEFAVLLRGRSRYAGRLLARGRLEVELLPMISVVIKGISDRNASNEDAVTSLRPPNTPAAQVNDEEAIAEAENAIEYALRALRSLKTGNSNRKGGESGSGSRRRR